MTDSKPGYVLLEKAARACRSARLPAEAGDVEGACNRAYYAMFDAARAALLRTSEDLTVATIGRSHQGLVTLFSDRLVRPGILDRELGRSLRRVQETRLAADYRPDAVTSADADEAIEQAERFLDAVRRVADSSGTSELPDRSN